MNEVPVPDYAHKALLGLFHDYAVIGGMPEIVDNYINDKNVHCKRFVCEKTVKQPFFYFF